MNIKDRLLNRLHTLREKKWNQMFLFTKDENEYYYSVTSTIAHS